jgi:hypothetical protein
MEHEIIMQHKASWLKAVMLICYVQMFLIKISDATESILTKVCDDFPAPPDECWDSTSN